MVITKRLVADLCLLTDNIVCVKLPQSELTERQIDYIVGIVGWVKNNYEGYPPKELLCDDYAHDCTARSDTSYITVSDLDGNEIEYETDYTEVNIAFNDYPPIAIIRIITARRRKLLQEEEKPEFNYDCEFKKIVT